MVAYDDDQVYMSLGMANLDNRFILFHDLKNRLTLPNGLAKEITEYKAVQIEIEFNYFYYSNFFNH